MIHHVVCWRVKEEALGLQKPELLLKMKTDLEALKGVIPEIAALHVGINEKPGDFAADLVLNSQFESWEALATYAAHPAHQEVVAFVGLIVEERRVVDFEAS